MRRPWRALIIAALIGCADSGAKRDAEAKQFAQVMGYAMNGPRSMGRAQFDLGGDNPAVESPSGFNASNAPSRRQAAL